MEWTAVTVIIALVGLGAAVIKPVVSLTQSITRLTVVVDVLQKNMDSMTGENTEAHHRIWEKNTEQDKRIDEHDKRITVIETR